VANSSSNTVSILQGKGDGTFQPAINYVSGANPHTVVPGHSSGGTLPALAIAESDQNTVGILMQTKGAPRK